MRGDRVLSTIHAMIQISGPEKYTQRVSHAKSTFASVQTLANCLGRAFSFHRPLVNSSVPSLAIRRSGGATSPPKSVGKAPIKRCVPVGQKPRETRHTETGRFENQGRTMVLAASSLRKHKGE